MNVEVRNDPDSKLGIYCRINPNLDNYVIEPQLILESELILLTRFRTGSHSLVIELGRYTNTPRERRLCLCKLGVQTLWHIFSECPLTTPYIETRYPDIQAIFSDENVHKHLLILTKKLKIPIGSL